MPNKKIIIDNIDQISYAIEKSSSSIKNTIESLNVKDSNVNSVSIDTIKRRLNESNSNKIEIKSIFISYFKFR